MNLLTNCRPALARCARLLILCLMLTFLCGVRAPADEVIPPDPPYRWFKGNLHTHSLWSDGNDFPEMIAEWYRVNGYNFLALSDHNILSQGRKWIDEGMPARRGAIGGVQRYVERFGTDWVEFREVDGKRQVRLKPLEEFRALVEERGRFLLIQGEEITDRAEGLPLHVNASNLRNLINPQGGKTVREALANNLNAVNLQSEQSGRAILGHLNHPNFHYAVTAEDLAAVLQEHFFEVFNGHPAVNHRGDEHHAGTERLWDIANTLRLAELQAPPLFGLATDDSHNYFGLRDSSPGRGWVMVRAKHLTPESIIRALQAGQFYASTGVTLAAIEYDAQAGQLTIEIAGPPDVEYTTQFIGSEVGVDTSSQPVLDDEGNPVRATRRYSPEVGKVLQTVTGPRAEYQFTGRELYVRATITAEAAPENPVWSEQKQQAWTQPVGWQQHLKNTSETP